MNITILSDQEGSDLIPDLLQEAGLDPNLVNIMSYRSLGYNQATVLADMNARAHDLIICLGSYALSVLVPGREGDKIGKLREDETMEWHDIPVRMSYSTKYLSKRGGKGSRDFQLVAHDIKRFAAFNVRAENNFKYELFGPNQVYEFLSKFIDAEHCALDYEGSSLEPTIADFQLGGIGLAREGYAAYLCFKDFGDLEYKLKPEDAKLIGKFLKMKNDRAKLMVFNLGYEVPTTRAVFHMHLDKIIDVMQMYRTLDITGGLKEISKYHLGSIGWTKEVDQWRDAFIALLGALKPTKLRNQPEYKPLTEGGIAAVVQFLQDKVEKARIAAEKKGEQPKPNIRVDKLLELIDRVLNMARQYYGDEAEQKVTTYLLHKLELREYECNYTEIPKEITGPYCGADCHNTLELYHKILPKIVEQKLEPAFGYYNRHIYLGTAMEQNGIAWDDTRASQIEAEHNEVMVDSMRRFLLSESVRRALRVPDGNGGTRPLSNQDFVDIQSSTDLNFLKGYFNPDSTAPANTQLLSRIMVTPLTRIALMLHEIGTEYQSDPEGATEKWPALVELIKMIYQTPQDQRGRHTLKQFLDAFATLKDGGYLQDKELDLYAKYASYHLPDASGDTIQTLMDAYTMYTGADLNKRESWIPEVEPVFYYKLFKKTSKAVSSFLNGAGGRKAVRIARYDAESDQYKLLARYEDRPLSDGEIYLYQPSYGVNRAKTKRWTSAYHGIPSMSESRQCFVSRYGDSGIFMKGDFSQHELRIIAALCQDPGLQEAFINNRDLHRMVASKMYDKPEDEVTDNERAVAKSANFGIVYLKTPESFAIDYLNGDVEAARRLFGVIFDMFPLLREWRDRQIASLHEQIAAQGGQFVRFPIHTLWGDPIWHEFDATKKMELIDAERYAVNWQVQSTASNLAGLALAETDVFLTSGGYKTKAFGFTHDSEEFDAHLDEFFLMLNKVPEISEKYLFDQFKLPVKLDMEMGINLGSLVEIGRVKGNDSFFNADGHAHLNLSGAVEDMEAAISRLSNRYDVQVLGGSEKEKYDSWSTVFSAKGCFYSGIGQTSIVGKREILVVQR